MRLTVKRKILITGCHGQLGRALMPFFSCSNDVVGVAVEDCDVRNYTQVETCLRNMRPDIVLHTAAYADVDGCEANQQLALDVNAMGTENVARACEEIGAKMVYYSTDYVFDGAKGSPYVETDPVSPTNVYGRSKLEGEKRLASLLENYVILRVAWLYGIKGENFVKKIVKLGLKQLEAQKRGGQIEAIKIVDDQIGNPTWTMDVADQTKVVIENDLVGLFHCTAEGDTSWYQFARDIFAILSLDVRMQPCPSDEFPRPAPRPRYTSLENKRLKDAGLNVMRDYQTALREFLNKHGDALCMSDVT
jgi:dTDP-4-dehydrorhamnose reductase